MKTSLNIPDEELEELMKRSKAVSRTEAVLLAIKEYNRRRRMKDIARQLGSFENFIDSSELKRLRSIA